MHAKNDIIDRLSRFRCLENVALCTNGRWVPFTATSALMSVVALIANGPVYRVAVLLVEGCDPSSVYIATYSAATAKDPNQRGFQYHIFGLDAIPREDGSVQIVEVNPFPNLDSFATDSLGRPQTGDSTEDQITAVTTLLKLLYGMYTDDLVDVSSVPS